MSTLKINKVTNAGSATDAPNGFTVGGAAVEQTYTSSATEPSSPATGDLWWDSGNDTLYRYVNGEFKALDTSASIAWYGDRAVFAGGASGAVEYNTMDYVNITSEGNATDFGDLTVAKMQCSGCSDSTYGLIMGGDASNAELNVIDYVTIATTGNASDFGDLTTEKRDGGALSDGTYGIYAGGRYNNDLYNVIEYVTIASPGNATDFGDLSQISSSLSGVNDATRGIFAVPYNLNSGGTFYNILEYITTATPGNSTDFGDMTVAAQARAGASDITRGVLAGGSINSNRLNTIDYITIQTIGNATDFGDLTVGVSGPAASSNGTRMVIGGGYNGATSSATDVIGFITIQTTGNAQDFGDLTVARNNYAGFAGASS